jgi:hypothetical protein
MKKKVILELVGLDGNAFSLMGAWRGAARRQGWSPEEIKTVMDECMSGDYNHLLATLMDNTESPEDAGDEDTELEYDREEYLS